MNQTMAAPQAAQLAGQQVPFADCHISPEARHAALEVLESGWVTTGPKVAQFEEAFASYTGASDAVAVSSCTAAIELALRSMKLPAGAPVLVSTLTFCGAVQAIVHAGLQPVLVDVSPVTGMPTESTTRQAAERCGWAAAMVVVHWAGDPADVPALATAARLPRDRVVEDAAHGLGGELQGGRSIGGEGTVCFSFYATKNLPIGEGGMVTTDDTGRAAWLRQARLHGMSSDAWRRYLPGGSWRYDVADAGLKANMTDLQAAIGSAQLDKLDGWQARRTEIVARYDEQLQDVLGLTLPHRPRDGAGRHAWHLYPVRILDGAARSRDDVIAFLREGGVGSSVHFIPVHQLTYFRRVAHAPPDAFPGADTLFEQLLSLPLYPHLEDSQVERVCTALRWALGRRWSADRANVQPPIPRPSSPTAQEAPR